MNAKLEQKVLVQNGPFEKLIELAKFQTLTLNLQKLFNKTFAERVKSDPVLRE